MLSVLHDYVLLSAKSLVWHRMLSICCIGCVGCGPSCGLSRPECYARAQHMCSEADSCSLSEPDCFQAFLATKPPENQTEEEEPKVCNCSK